jgi:hypothetical protein
MTGNFQFISVTNFDEPRPKQLADPGISEPPHCWTVILPQFTLSRHVEVLIASAETIIVVDAQDATDQVRVTDSLKYYQFSMTRRADFIRFS